MRGGMIHHRHYTVEEANAKLDLVGRIVRRIRDARRRLSDEAFDTEFTSLAELSGGAYPGREHAVAALAEDHVALVRYRGEHRIPDGFCGVAHLLEWAKAGGRFRT